MSTKRNIEWQIVRKEWKKLNPPDHAGYYVCGICGKPVHYTDMEVDHIGGRLGRNLVEKKNLQPSHVFCNRIKGSKKQIPKVSQAEYEFRKEFDI